MLKDKATGKMRLLRLEDVKAPSWIYTGGNEEMEPLDAGLGHPQVKSLRAQTHTDDMGHRPKMVTDHPYLEPSLRHRYVLALYHFTRTGLWFMCDVLNARGQESYTLSASSYLSSMRKMVRDASRLLYRAPEVVMELEVCLREGCNSGAEWQKSLPERLTKFLDDREF